MELLGATLEREQSAFCELLAEQIVGSIDSLGKIISAVIRSTGEIIDSGNGALRTSATVKVEKIFFGKDEKPFFLVVEENDVGYFIDPPKGDDQPPAEPVHFYQRGGALSIEVKKDKTLESKQRILFVGLRSDRLSCISDAYRYLPGGGLVFDHMSGVGLVELRKELMVKDSRAFDKALKSEDTESLQRYYAALLTGASALFSAVLSSN